MDAEVRKINKLSIPTKLFQKYTSINKATYFKQQVISFGE